MARRTMLLTLTILSTLAVATASLAEFEAFEAQHAKVWSSATQRAAKLATGDVRCQP